MENNLQYYDKFMDNISYVNMFTLFWSIPIQVSFIHATDGKLFKKKKDSVIKYRLYKQFLNLQGQNYVKVLVCIFLNKANASGIVNKIALLTK